MSTTTDDQLGFAIESTYGTPVTVSRFLPMLAETSHQWTPRPVYGAGMLTSSYGMKRGGRRVVGRGQGSLELAVEMESKGLGLLLGLAHTVRTSTVVSGSTYQQVFSPSRTTNVLQSATVQLGIVRADDAGTVDTYTYAGCTATGFTLSAGDGIPVLKVALDALDLSTSTAREVPSYATAPSLFHHDSGSTALGNGTLTTPTPTAVASLAGSPTTGNVRSWELSVDYGADVERWNIGNRGRPVLGQTTAQLKFMAEYTTAAERDAFLAGTGLSFLATHTTTEALSTGVATMQLVVPQMFIDESMLPQPTAGELTTAEVTGEITLNGTQHGWYVVMRTADTAL